MREVVILDGARTAFGEFGGSLIDIGANYLGAIAARKAIERSGIRPDHIDHVIFGNALQTSPDAVYGARHVGLKSGVPMAVPAVTVNQVCGSGLHAIIYGIQLIQLGAAEICLVGGMENMSQAPHVVRGARWKSSLGRGEMEDSLWTALIDSYNNMPLGLTADNLGQKYGVTREQQDEYALSSQMCALGAREKGLLAEEITPVMVPDKKDNEIEFTNDEHIRNISMETLAKMKPAFRPDGGVTPGNSSGIGDGAAALIVASRKKAKELGLVPRAKISSYAVCGVDPDAMGIGPVPAMKIASKDASVEVRNFDLYEVNEAYAAQYLVCEKELGLDRSRVNVNGGAIAIGNPLAATGARIVLTLMYEMNRRQARNGIAALSVAGGQGDALAIEKFIPK